MSQKNYQILTDATADLSAQLVAENDIEVIPMQFVVDDDTYSHYPDEREIAVKDIYARLRAGSKAHTNSIAPGIYEEEFSRFLKQGMDVLYISFSSGLSCTFQTSQTVAQELREHFPERRIECIDSLCASAGQGLLAYAAAKKQQEGLSFDELTAWIKENIPHLCHWFTVDDLAFLHRGGRVSATSAVVGGALQIKPVMHVDDEGHLIVMEKVRGRRQSLVRLADHMQKTGTNLEQQDIFIGHGDDEAGAGTLAEIIRERIAVKSITLLPIGPVIGTHSGPGTIALFFFGTKR